MSCIKQLKSLAHFTFSPKNQIKCVEGIHFLFMDVLAVLQEMIQILQLLDAQQDALF
jgi:hypothetical protein